MLAYQFLAQIETYLAVAERLRAMPEPPGVSEVVVTPTFGVAALLLMFLVPVLTMGSLSGERRAGTLALLYSSPVTSLQIVLGKYVGVWSLLVVIWIATALMPLTLLWGAPLDLGVYACGLLALLLLMAAYSAIGLMFSAMFAQPALAAVMSFAVIAGLWLVDWAARLGQSSELFAYVSSLNHFRRLASGLIDSTDVAYFLIITAAALGTAVWRLDGDRKPL
jgi:ABC-2 type transport system permease protein